LSRVRIVPWVFESSCVHPAFGGSAVRGAPALWHQLHPSLAQPARQALLTPGCGANA